MSAAAFIDAIGFASAILTTVGFAQSNLPGGGPQGAEVQIKAGRGDRDSSELGGGITAVYAFDNSNSYLGKSGSGSMGDGGVVSLTIDQAEPGVQADYISVENSDDATCISWVAVNQFDGRGTKGAWLGDIGYACGQPWYYGNQAIDEDGNIKPYCTWLDGNGDPTDKAAMKFRLQPYVGDNAQKTLDDGRQCTETVWGTDKGPISGTPGKRSLKARTEDMENELIISNFSSHTAGNLCNSETSWGPDFVGSDGKLCDMASKTLTSLCSTEDVDGCVDLDDVEGTVTKRMTVARRSTHVPHKKYSKVSKWE